MMAHADSTDNGDTWPETPILIPDIGYWHGAGIIHLAAPGTNKVYSIGADYGSVEIATPILKGRQFIAQDLRVHNGLVAADGYS